MVVCSVRISKSDCRTRARIRGTLPFAAFALHQGPIHEDDAYGRKLPEVLEAMSEPIPDKAQVSIDFPHKFYMGSFGRESRFDVTADEEGVHIHLDRPGDERRHVGFHVHYSHAGRHPARHGGCRIRS